MSKIKKLVYIALGLLFVVIGAAARFAPGIPTTPFLLLALYCFSRSSEKLFNWLKNTHLYRKYLENYVNTGSMSRKQKVTIQIIASTMMALSFMALDNLVFRIAMVILFLVHHYVFIFRIKTSKANEKEWSTVDREQKKDIK